MPAGRVAGAARERRDRECRASAVLDNVMYNVMYNVMGTGGGVVPSSPHFIYMDRGQNRVAANFATAP